MKYAENQKRFKSIKLTLDDLINKISKMSISAKLSEDDKKLLQKHKDDYLADLASVRKKHIDE